MKRLAGISKWLEWALWVLIIVGLPITSLPLLSHLMGGAMVAPPALVFYAILGIVWFIPLMINRGTIEKIHIPLIAFFCAAIISTLIALFLPVPTFRQNTLLRSSLEGLLTLGAGCMVYLFTAEWPTGIERITRVLRWLYWGGLVVILWSMLQFGCITFLKHYPDWVETIQGVISITGLMNWKRALGFTMEPSWLAHQMNLLYLPFWLAATVKRTSLYQWRLARLSFENILLAGGLITLLITFSRIGWLAMMGCTAFLVIRLTRKLILRLQSKAPRHWHLWIRKWVIPLITIFICLVLLSGLILSVAFVMSKLDPRMSTLFQPLEKGETLIHLSQRLIFADRIVYWQTGWEIFNQYPWFGVGPGNAGYFFMTHLPAYGLSMEETNALLNHRSGLPNIKSLWIRLLAETGIVGISLFCIWLYLLWQASRNLENSSAPIFKALGLTGKLVLIALVFEGFSVDSFALPYYWFSLGILSAAWKTQWKRGTIGDGRH